MGPSSRCSCLISWGSWHVAVVIGLPFFSAMIAALIPIGADLSGSTSGVVAAYCPPVVHCCLLWLPSVTVSSTCRLRWGCCLSLLGGDLAGVIDGANAVGWANGWFVVDDAAPVVLGFFLAGAIWCFRAMMLNALLCFLLLCSDGWMSRWSHIWCDV